MYGPRLPAVAVYQLARDVDWWVWLCRRCLRAWLVDGWQVRVCRRPRDDLTCDCCQTGHRFPGCRDSEADTYSA